MAKSRTSESQEPVLDPVSLITDRLRLLITRRDEMWWDIGELLDEAASRAFDTSRPAGFATFVREVLWLPVGEARRMQRVARHFSRDVAMRFGAEKLDLLLSFLDACREDHWAVDPLRIKILAEKGTGIPFAEATPDDLKKAARSARRRVTASDPRVDPEVGKARDHLDRELSRELGRKKAPRVKIHRSLDPKKPVTLALVDLDPSQLGAVAKVLTRVGRSYAKKKPKRKK